MGRRRVRGARLRGAAISAIMACSVIVAPVRALSVDGVSGPPATATAAAARGPRFQLFALPPPPALCAAGAFIRGVDVGARKIIAFSFDDGPWPTYTQAVMSSFEQRGLRSTFFWIGDNVNRYPDIARDVVARGFEVGNHSQTHHYTASTIAREVPIANQTIRNITGEQPTLFRSPGLTQGESIQNALRDNGMCNIFTTVVLGDADLPRASAGTLCSRFANTVHAGEVVLLHDGGSHSQTVRAVPCMLDLALSRGYEIVTVGELLLAGTPYAGPRTRTNLIDTVDDQASVDGDPASLPE